ncbi:hypothetical protein J6590_108376 [Homalodisca vitripennis]|nr:hypothetical protein J6590_108376 [Homalodisca vitripennis]
MAVNGLESLVNEPTRITVDSATCIDHVYARLYDKRSVTIDVTTIHAGITDHSLVCIALGGVAEGETRPPPPPHRDGQRINYVNLKQLIAAEDWSCVYNKLDPSSAFDSFIKTFKNCISCSRESILQKNKFKKLKPWINDTICYKIKKEIHYSN